jgi:hypothetical protein
MPQAAPTPALAIPLPKDGSGSIGHWTTQIEQAKKNLEQIRRKYKWNVNVERYTLSRETIELRSGTAVLLPKDYSYTEQKLALLFYQTPEVVLTAARPDVTADTAGLMQAVLNDLVGPSKLNAKATVDEILRDILVPAGVGIAKIGYEAFVDPEQPTVPMQVGEEPALDETGQPLMQPMGAPTLDPLTGALMPPPMHPVMQPIYEDVPNIIRERKFLERVSPVDFLSPANFRGSDWVKPSWLATRCRVPSTVATQVYGIDAEMLRAYRHANGTPPTDNDSLSPDKTTQVFDGVEVIDLWYRAIDVDPTVGDPDLIRWLVLLEGTTPIKHQNSPYQDIDQGRVVGGLRRFPIYPLTLRYVPDSPFPPSDCAMSRVIVDELSKGRTQMIEQRDRNVPLRTIAIDKLTPDAKDRVLRGQTQELIPVEGLQAGEKVIDSVQTASFPDENFNFNNYGERDLQECWALSSQNLGQTGTSGRTATELSIANAATDTRMESERIRVLSWWTQIVEGLGVLVQRYDDTPQYVNVLGPDGASRLVQWTRQDIQGEYAFHIRPDSARRVDQAAERKFRVDVFNLLANDPTLNRQELIRWMAPTLGLDPEKLFKPPEPPKGPEPPKVSMSFAVKPEDLINPLVVQILQAQGIVPPAQTPAPAQSGPPPTGAQPPIGQSAGRIPPVNQHAADQTGRLDGNGSATSRPS